MYQDLWEARLCMSTQQALQKDVYSQDVLGLAPIVPK